jgi:uncharacterized protein YgiM (DUF1202 family)
VHGIRKYAAVLAVLVLAVCLVGGLALHRAVEIFTPSELVTAVEPEEPADVTTGGASELVATSPLAGAELGAADRTASAEEEGGDWVRAVAGVNMRSGPTRANPVIGVARKGVRLRVAYRDGDWVEVIEPDNGTRGWVYGKFVQASPQGAPSP